MDVVEDGEEYCICDVEIVEEEGVDVDGLGGEVEDFELCVVLVEFMVFEGGEVGVFGFDGGFEGFGGVVVVEFYGDDGVEVFVVEKGLGGFEWEEDVIVFEVVFGFENVVDDEGVVVDVDFFVEFCFEEFGGVGVEVDVVVVLVEGGGGVGELGGFGEVWVGGIEVEVGDDWVVVG